MQITKIRKNGSLLVGTEGFEPTLTQQQFKDECDINQIMKRFASTGDFANQTKPGTGQYGDFTKVKDYQGMHDTVLMAQQAFASLPSATRSRFRNDPGLLLDFMSKPENYDEALKLGLVNPKKVNDNSNDKNPKSDQTTSQNPAPSKLRKTTTVVEEPV